MCLGSGDGVKTCAGKAGSEGIRQTGGKSPEIRAQPDRPATGDAFPSQPSCQPEAGAVRGASGAVAVGGSAAACRDPGAARPCACLAPQPHPSPPGPAQHPEQAAPSNQGALPCEAWAPAGSPQGLAGTESWKLPQYSNCAATFTSPGTCSVPGTPHWPEARPLPGAGPRCGNWLPGRGRGAESGKVPVGASARWSSLTSSPLPTIRLQNRNRGWWPRGGWDFPQIGKERPSLR